MIRICLYLTIPQIDEDAPLAISPFGRVKRFAHQCIDVFNWIALKRHSITFWACQRLAKSNKGDSIIRESIKQQLATQFGSSNVIFQELRWGDLAKDVID